MEGAVNLPLPLVRHSLNFSFIYLNSQSPGLYQIPETKKLIILPEFRTIQCKLLLFFSFLFFLDKLSSLCAHSLNIFKQSLQMDPFPGFIPRSVQYKNTTLLVESSGILKQKVFELQELGSFISALGTHYSENGGSMCSQLFI